MENRKQPKKQRWKIVLYALLTLLIVGGGIGIYAYQKVQPENHFENVSVVTKPVQASEGEEEEIQVQPKSGVFNVLIMGTDQRKDEPAGHSDSMMIVHVDLDKKQYNAVSIPRDTRVYLKGYGYTKLTSVQYIIQANKGSLDEGVQAAAQAVSTLTGVTINYYAETNYWGMKDMVDALGGIEMDVPFDIKLTHSWIPTNHGKVVKAGKQFLDGTMVVEISRERHSVADGEFGRQQVQEKALLGVAQTVLKPENIVRLPKLLDSLPEFLTATNMTKTDIVSLGLALKDFKPEQLQYHQLPGEYKTMYDDILKNENLELVVDQVKVKQLVADYFSNN